MKLCLAACLSCLFGSTLTVLGQVPTAPHPHSLSVQVEPVSSGGTSDIEDNAHTRAVSHDANDPAKRVHETRSTKVEKNERRESLEVDVRNFGPLPDTARVEFYFMARPVQGNRGDYILDEGSRPVTVASGATVTLPIESKKVIETIKRKANTHAGRHGGTHLDRGSDKDSGSTMTGWMVRVVADGKVLDARGSKEALEDEAKDLSKLPIIK